MASPRRTNNGAAGDGRTATADAQSIEARAIARLRSMYQRGQRSGFYGETTIKIVWRDGRPYRLIENWHREELLTEPAA